MSIRDLGQFQDPSNAYLAAVAQVLDNPSWHVSPRGQICQEVLDLGFSVSRPTTGPLITRSATRNQTMAKYLAVEEELYLSGERRAEVWASRASKFWGKLGDGGGLVTSNYGWLMTMNQSLPGGKTPWEWARDSLLKDPDSRQAYVRVSLPDHQWEGNPDQTCTMHMMFVIRGGKLWATTVMRSCDVIRGLAYDLPWFCRCLLRMGRELTLPVGGYTHLAHSMHLYGKDREVAMDLLGRVGGVVEGVK